MDNEWTSCEVCETEYKVMTNQNISVDFCPFCGADVNHNLNELQFEDSEQLRFGEAEEEE